MIISYTTNNSATRILTMIQSSSLSQILPVLLVLMCAYMYMYVWLLLLLLSRFSRVWLCATPETAAHQAPPSLGFSRQEHWSGLPFPSPMHESETWKWSRSVVSNSQWPHGLQPTRLLHLWDFPGKSTGVGVPLPSPCVVSSMQFYHILYPPPPVKVQNISITTRMSHVALLQQHPPLFHSHPQHPAIANWFFNSIIFSF